MTSGEFAINGRFLGQRATGVQRYARSVSAEMGRVLASRGGGATLVAPVGTSDPGLEGLGLLAVGPGGGHAWEQGVLPLRWGGRLLNLGNTGPARKRDQVVCVHDANVFEAPDSYGRAFRATYRALLPAIAARAARVATVSTHSAERLGRHLGLRVRDVAVLPNGHEHALAWDAAAAVAAPAALAARPRGPDRPFALAIGSRARHKNLALVAAVAPRLAEAGIDVVVAGGGGRIFASTGPAAPSGVIELGEVTDADLAHLLDRATCLVFPSWTEGFGLPIVEAMARGCPVVSSDRASMPEVCGAAAIMAAPDDPGAWVEAVAALASSPGRREDLAGAGRERARLFSWGETARGYLDLMAEPSARVSPRRDDLPLPTVALAIPTMGRPEVVSRNLRHVMATQTHAPVAATVCAMVPGDEGDVAELPGVTVVRAPSGLSRQRNAALEGALAAAEVVVFLDDDFVPDPGWLEAAARAFRDDPGLVCLTGRVVADGVKGPGIPFDEALRLLDADSPGAVARWEEPFSPYGCNMALRSSAVGAVRFDERLPFYSWLEDRDFGATLARGGGALARSSALRGVHMGTKGGRGPGDRLGYSQVANPLYMMGKGTMTPGQVAGQLFRNLASNLAGSVRPEPHVDRRGRLRGNARALLDAARGVRDPGRAGGDGKGR